MLIFFKNTTDQPAAALAASQLLSLAGQNGMDADTTSNGAYITEDSLKKYSSLIFLQTSSDVLETAQQNDVERFVQAGGGLGVVNAAGFTQYQWPWYNDLLAGGINPPTRISPFSGPKLTTGGVPSTPRPAIWPMPRWLGGS